MSGDVRSTPGAARRRIIPRRAVCVLLLSFAGGCGRGDVAPPAASAIPAPAPNDAANETAGPVGAASRVANKPADPLLSTTFVAMRDGTKLFTEVMLPTSGKPPFPTVLIRGPYSSYVNAFTIMTLRDQGYAMVTQDVRGCGKSEGEKTNLFHHDGWNKNRDGHDTLDWIVRQPWSNGKVGTFGFSALGTPANLLAPGAPDSLRCQYVLFASSDLYSQACYQGGVWREDVLGGWFKQNGLEANLPALRANDRYGPIWEELDCEKQAARVNAPAVFVAGWFDMFLQGSINSFTTIQLLGGPRARGRCRLVIGPWAHRESAGYGFPRGDMYRDHPKAGDPWRFYARYLKEERNGVDDDQPVHYYVLGDPADPPSGGCCWRSADDWPPPATPTKFFLRADRTLSRSPAEKQTEPLAFDFDPRRPVPTVGGLNFGVPSGPLDQRPVEQRPDVLVFTSLPLESPLEVAGRISAELFVSSDCPDTDFTAKLTDVFPDGSSILVADGVVRASRQLASAGSRDARLDSGGVRKLSVDLWSTCRVFARGHRVRAAISSSNFPRFEPNSNTGAKKFDPANCRVARNLVHCGGDAASCLMLPIAAPPSSGSCGAARANLSANP